MRIAFLLVTNAPSEWLRARMIAAAMKQRPDHGCAFEVSTVSLLDPVTKALDVQRMAAWVTKLGSAPAHLLPHVVVSVKLYPPRQLLRALWSRCIVFALDILDNVDHLNSILKTWRSLPDNSYAPRTVLIVQTNETVAAFAGPPTNARFRNQWDKVMQCGGIAQPLAVVPHQQTNVGRWRVAAPETRLRPVRAVGLLVGQNLNAPTDAMVAQLASATCALQVALHYIYEGQKAGRPVVRVYHCTPDGHAMPFVIAPNKRFRVRAESRDEGCLADDPSLFNFSSQRKFHDVSWVDDIDVALLWPPNRRARTLLHRPPTRMLWWWSHGVPTILFPYAAYIETAVNFGYALPDGTFPVADTPARVTAVLGALIAQPTARQSLAATGIHVVREAFAPEAIAARMLRELREQIGVVRRAVHRCASAPASAPSLNSTRSAAESYARACSTFSAPDTCHSLPAQNDRPPLIIATRAVLHNSSRYAGAANEHQSQRSSALLDLLHANVDPEDRKVY